MRPIDKLVVHCSATKNGQNVRAADIRAWHTKPKSKGGNGWSDIGYHYVITLEGVVELGRPLEQEGAHASGHNKTSIGVCLIGGLDAKGKPCGDYTPLQWEALSKLLREQRQRFPDTEILGHRDLPKVAKDCPCFDVRTWCKSRGIDPKRS